MLSKLYLFIILVPMAITIKKKEWLERNTYIQIKYQHWNSCPVYKHEEKDEYLYCAKDGWWVGPNMGDEEGTIHVKSSAMTPNKVTETWQEQQDGKWEVSEDISAEWEGKCSTSSLIYNYAKTYKGNEKYSIKL